MFTQRDRATVSIFDHGHKREVELPLRRGLGVRRDRPDGPRGRPRLRHATAASTPAREAPARRSRRAGDGLDARRARPDHQQQRWSAGSPPAAAATAAAGCSPPTTARSTSAPVTPPGHQPPGPDLAGRQDAAPGRDDRRAVAGQPVHRRRRTPQALRPELRPPQRPGPGRAQGPEASGRSSRAPSATTRSTCSSAAATTAGTRCRATTSRSR